MLPSVAPSWFAGAPQASSLPYSLFPMNLGMWPLGNGAPATQPVMPQATQTTVMTAAGPMVVTMTAAPLAIPQQQMDTQRQTAQPMASSPPMTIDMARSPDQMQSPLSDDASFGSGSPPKSSDDDMGRRTATNMAEKARRSVLKNGFEELKMMVPEVGRSCSKAKILQRAVDYVSELVREKTTLLHEVDKLRQEVQQLRKILTHYEALQALPPAAEAAEAFAKAQSMQDNTPADQTVSDTDIKFLVFMCMIDRLYETFCATVTLDNNQAFTTSLMKWFEAHCTAETFVRPLQYLMHRFLSERSARTIGYVAGAVNSAMVGVLNGSGRMGVPYAKELGAKLDYVGAICSLDASEAVEVVA